jgi:hypothetical protein
MPENYLVARLPPSAALVSYNYAALNGPPSQCSQSAGVVTYDVGMMDKTSRLRIVTVKRQRARQSQAPSTPALWCCLSNIIVLKLHLTH